MFIVLLTVLIPTVAAVVYSYTPNKQEEYKMDRQDIKDVKKPLPKLSI